MLTTVKFAGLDTSGLRISGGFVTILPAVGRTQTEDEDVFCAIPGNTYITVTRVKKTLQAILNSCLRFLLSNTAVSAASFNIMISMMLIMLVFSSQLYFELRILVPDDKPDVGVVF